MPDSTVATTAREAHARRDASTPASPAQAGFWFAQRLAPASAALNQSRAYRLHGPLDAAALAAAWRHVVDNHPALRSLVVESAGTGLPELVPADPPALSYLDGSGLSEADRWSWLQELASRPFDLAAEPPARLGLLRLGADRYDLTLVLHAVADYAGCVDIVIDALSSAYAGAVDSDGAAPMVAAPRSHGETGVEDDGYDERVRWWADRLTPTPPALDLPVDRARPAGPASAAGRLRFRWDNGFGARVVRHAEAEGSTLDAVLLAAFLTLLHRHSGAERIAVVTNVSPCSGARSQRLSTPRVRVGDFTEAPTWRELVAAQTEADRAETDLAHVTIAEVLRVVGVDRDPRRTPLTDAVFTVCEPDRGPRLRGVSSSPLDIHSGATAADIHLTVTRPGRVLAGTLEYRADLFNDETAVVLLAHLRALLAAAVAAPDTAVDALPLEHPAIAMTAAGSPDPAPVAATVLEQVAGHAATKPKAPAAMDTDGKVALEYLGLHSMALAVADALRANGITAGDAVVVRVNARPLSYAALLGAHWAGAHVLWLSTDAPGERDLAVLADLRPAALLTDSDSDSLALTHSAAGGRVLDLRGISASKPGHHAAVDPNTRAYVAYTSGSTGTPKGIAHTHAALAQLAAWMSEAFDIGPGARVAQWVTPEHDPAIAEVFATLAAGGALYPVPARVRVHPERLAAWLAEHDITHLQTVAGFAGELLRTLRALPSVERPGRLRHLLLMGEAVTTDLAHGLRDVLPETRLYNVYGPTETIVATWHEVTGTEGAVVPIGRPVPGRQVLVLDRHDHPCPTGVTGEIVIRTPYVTHGYIGAAGDPAVFRPVAANSPPSGCYRTGDLARRRPDGALEFRGRRDFQVKLLGNRVELTEIEAALATHPGVDDCAVVAESNAERHVSRLVVHVVPRPDTIDDPAGWRAHLRARFGGLAIPAIFVVSRERLPRNRSGKVDRARLPAPRYGGKSEARLIGTAAAVARLWTQVIDVPDELGLDDDFFAVGGHSLLLAVLARRIRDRLGAELSLWDLLAARTVAGMAALVDSARGAEVGHQPQVEPGPRQ